VEEQTNVTQYTHYIADVYIQQPPAKVTLQHVQCLWLATSKTTDINRVSCK